MNTPDENDRPETESLAFDFDVAHPPERVWRALTDPTLLAQWLLPVVAFKLEPGAAFQFQAPPQPGWDGVVDCRLEEVEAGRRLRYAWVVGDLDTVVTFTLTPTATGTRLSLVQSGFKPHQKHNRGGARYGWRTMTERLWDLLARLP